MTLTAVLMAGGLSRRMGADKCNLLVNAERLWSRQMRLLDHLNPRSVWVSARARPSWCPTGTEAVLDAAPSHGPLSGLSAVLQRLATSHLLVLAVDLPLMNAPLLRSLCQMAEPGRGVMPQIAGWLEPLCAIYPAQVAPAAQAALQSGCFALQPLARALIAKDSLFEYKVPPGLRWHFANINTPEALDRCRSVIR